MPPLASGSPRSDPEVPPLVHSNTASTIASTALDTESHSHMHFGYPPEVDFFDEKPFHYNESGSKNQKTLEWKGKQEVELLECPAQATRSRWTACTYATSDSSLNREGTQPLRIPPAQLMFKERMTPIIQPTDTNLHTNLRLQNGVCTEAPDVEAGSWLSGFRKEKRISFRVPNKRWMFPPPGAAFGGRDCGGS
jgi:hypothetical protein